MLLVLKEDPLAVGKYRPNEAFTRADPAGLISINLCLSIFTGVPLSNFAASKKLKRTRG